MKKRRIFVTIICVCLMAAALLWDVYQWKNPGWAQKLIRDETDRYQETLKLHIDGDNVMEYQVTVDPVLYTKQQKEACLNQAMKELETTILGENESADCIVHTLEIPQTLQEGLVEVSCEFWPAAVVDWQGTILWENVTEEPTLVKVIAQLSCQEEMVSHEFYLSLMPGKRDSKEVLKEELNAWLEMENEKSGTKEFLLPNEVKGQELRWEKSRESLTTKVILLGIVLVLGRYVLLREHRNQRLKERQDGLIRDYPQIVNQFAVLVGAGLTVSAAWEKMVCQYQRFCESGAIRKSPGYEEMAKALREMQGGAGERMAYENFADRCQLPSYRKFVSILVQNLRKGSKGMQTLLESEAREANVQRKLYVRQKGEEAGTKLLIPMGIMLVLVLALFMIPALFSLSI